MNLHELTSIIVQALFAFIFILGFITIVILLVVNILCKEEKNKTDNINNKDNKDNNGNNIDEFKNKDIIDKNYIKKYYKSGLINALKGKFSNDTFIFFINHNDPEDVKLPYELLSPTRVIKNDERLFKFDTSGYDQFIITRAERDSDLSSNLNFGVTLGYFHDEMSYKLYIENDGGFLKMCYNFTYYYDVSIDKISDRKLESKNKLINFIQKNNLNSQELVDYYLNVIKLKQPSLEEMYDILIKFEKSKKELLRINTLNSQEKVSHLIDDFKQKHNNNYQYDNIDRELLSLFKNNDIKK